MRRCIGIVCTATLLITATSACADGGQPSQPSATPSAQTREFPNWPETLDQFRFHWSSDPGVDLAAGPAVPVRAYLESYFVASFARNPKEVYPGFTRATPENDDLDGHYLAQLAHIRPLHGVDARPEDALEHFGYMPLHLLSIDRIEGGYRAIVCQGEYADFIRSTAQPGKFVSTSADPKTAQLTGSGDGAVSIHRIELTDNQPGAGSNPPPPAVTAPQHGPAPAPDQDVFGNWFITGATSSFWGPIDAPQPERIASPDLLRQCSDRMPLPEAQRITMMTGFKDQPPPHGEAIPGWPAKAQ